MNRMDETLKTPTIRRRGRGQGLPEYALILVLVAIVSIVALVLIGSAVQRVYGWAAGGLGARASNARESSDTFITIDSARCVAVRNYPNRPGGPGGNGPATGIEVLGRFGPTSRLSVDDITVGTPKLFDKDADGRPTWVKDLGGGRFEWSFFISFEVADLGLCPGSATAQVTDGSNAIATSPVKLETY